MPQHCKICEHSQREEIEAKLSGEWERSLRDIGQHYGVSKDSLSRHSQAHMQIIEDDDQADEARQDAQERDAEQVAADEEREYLEFLRRWEHRSWLFPAPLRVSFSLEFNDDRAEKLSGLLAKAFARGHLVERVGLYYRTDQLTSWLDASNATA